jgi:hypothetical protein
MARLQGHVQSFIRDYSASFPFLSSDCLQCAIGHLPITGSAQRSFALQTVRWRVKVDESVQFIHIMDGAAKGNPSLAGVGGVLRYPNGNCYTAFSSFLGHATNMEGECINALLHGLTFCVVKNIRVVQVQTDSTALLQCYSGLQRVSWHLQES